MSVKINLLPDIRQAKIRARHVRQLASAIAGLICGISVAVVVLLLIVTSAQKLQIAGLSKDITQKQSELSSKSDLQQLVTLQQHLDSLPDIYKTRPSLNAFLSAVEAASPTDLSFVNIDLTNLTSLKATGKSKSMGIVDKLVKSMAASKDEAGNYRYTDIVVTTESQDPTVGIVFDLAATVNKGVTSATN